MLHTHLRSVERPQNLILRAREFDNASWGKTNCTVASGDTDNDPNGSATAEHMTDSADGGATQHYVSQAPSVTIANGTMVTWWVYAKPGTIQNVAITPNAAGVGQIFILSGAGSKGSTVNSAPKGAGVIAIANGWYLCWCTVAHNSASPTGRIYMTSSNTAVTYTGAGTGTLLLWNAGIRYGGFGCPLVNTSASAVK